MVVTLKDGFERCAMHGLAAFHGLQSTGITNGDGARGVRLRRPPPPVTPTTPAGTAASEQILATRRRHSGSRSRSGTGAREGSAVPLGDTASPPATSGAAGGPRGSSVGASAAGDSCSGVPPGGPSAHATKCAWGAGSGEGSRNRSALDTEGGEGGGRGRLVGLPFTAVDVLMVLQEDVGGLDSAVVPGGLTAAALKQHRDDHLPPELSGAF